MYCRIHYEKYRFVVTYYGSQVTSIPILRSVCSSRSLRMAVQCALQPCSFSSIFTALSAQEFVSAEIHSAVSTSSRFRLVRS